MPQREKLYDRIIEHVFFAHYAPDITQFTFRREELNAAAQSLGLRRALNPGDLIYTYRYRRALPQRIRDTQSAHLVWMLPPAGRAIYRFVLRAPVDLTPNTAMAETKLPDATPGIVARYALSDEQALLAKVRYNRLLDIFTGVTCYALQSHLRTTAPDMGQVETDELYVGVDKRGAHYVIPVQAKGGTDQLSIIQIEQDMAVCASKFPTCVCRAIATQFMAPDLIALFEFEPSEEGARIVSERHYRLVPQEQVTSEDLIRYRTRGET